MALSPPHTNENSDPVPIWLDQHEYAEWDAFVGQHPYGLIYHLSSWKEAIERAFSHIKGHFLVLRSGTSGKIFGGIPVYSICSWLLGNRIVSIPYASICDPLISSPHHFKLLWPKILDLQASTASHHIELRSVHGNEYVNNIPFCSRQNFLHHYLPLNEPIEDIKKNLPYNLRREIKKAHLHGLKLKKEKGKNSIYFLYHLITNTRKKLCLPPIPLKLFESIDQSLYDRMSIFFAVQDQTNIASLLALHYKNTIHIEFYGGIPQAYQTGASHFLHWEVIKYAHDIGCKLISFGRTHPQNSGLIGFKRRWNTVEEQITISRVVSKNCVHKRFEKGRDNLACRLIFGKAPLLIRKAFASFLYHHHG